VRRFQQDDGHIFCRPEDVQSEIEEALKFIDFVYGKFELKYEMFLSTRPQKFIGEKATWDDAERQLGTQFPCFTGSKVHILTQTRYAASRGAQQQRPRVEGESGGRRVLRCYSVYVLYPYARANTDSADCAGPKIDINVFDALGRKHQCATIQLDFQLPIRFGLKYNAPPSAEGGEETEQRPVLIHRAIFGSLERFTAILIEHIAGKWPLWLSPRQVAIVPVGSDQQEYGAEVQAVLRKEGYHADLDSSSKTLQKKIRDNQLAQYNYILVVGKEEVESKTVNVRTRDNQVHGAKSIPELLSELKAAVAAFQ
jgi:threonyl-tRNA synthetase